MSTKVRKRIQAALIVGLAAEFILSSSFAVASTCTGHAPEPSGAFAVAASRFDVSDLSRIDRLDEEADSRQFSVDAYYPAENPARAAPYAAGVQKEVVLSAWPLEEDVMYRRCLWLSPSPEPKQDGETYPVIIFSHGLSWPSAAYRSLLLEIASHGYVVLAITHTHASSLTAFADGRKVDMSLWPIIEDEEQKQLFLADYLPEWIADIRHVASLLKSDGWRDARVFGELIDPDSDVGLMGHSYGASAAARALDGQLIHVAYMMEGRYRGPAIDEAYVPQGVIAHVLGNYNRLELEGNQYRPGKWPVYEYVINGAWHASFSDLVMLYRLNAPEDWKKHHYNELDPERAIRITTRLATAFFDGWLKGKHSAYLHPVSYGNAVQSPQSGGFPEVELTIDLNPADIDSVK